ncbi:cardiac-enriched FHL2-interacting protein isoform 1-T3 [Molossus nigricans]
MQGNKKCADGFSDTSSIGSVLDDADREVSSLTDRAFRSLCISEDTSFSDSDLTLSPELTRQVLGTCHQGSVSHTRRKSGIWSQLPSQGAEHAGWAATFQQLPKYVQGEEECSTGSPPLTPALRRLEVPLPGLRSSSKPTPKVSSLIKSFDRPPTSKPPAAKSPPKFAPLPDSGVNFCFDSAFLTVRRVPAEGSGRPQGHQPGRQHAEREAPGSPEVACQGPGSSSEPRLCSPPHRAAAGEPGRSQEWARKGTFLHSENSAFESWSSRQPRLRDRKGPAEAAPEGRPPTRGSAPQPREPRAPERRLSPCPLRAGCGQEDRLAAGTVSAPGPWRAADPGVRVSPGEDNASGAQPDLQRKSAQAPWRKPKARRGGKASAQGPAEGTRPSRPGPALCAERDPQGPCPENEAPDRAAEPGDCYTPPFNISELLTPIIPTKQVLEPSSSPPAETAPPPAGQLNGFQEQEPGESAPRDGDRAAPGLLFHLKDVRRRVRSTYSPLVLLKGDERGRGKQDPVSNGVLPDGLEESPPQAPPEERAADTPLSYVSTQGDPKADPGAPSADNCLTLGSPPALTKASFCVNGEAAGNSPEQDATKDGSERGAARHSWSPDPRERLGLPLRSAGPAVGRPLRPHTPRLENGFCRSLSQETEPETEAGLQNPNFTQKVSPGPLSPEEEDVFYSDTQSDFAPGLQGKAKFSTSSSDQSFASFEDQQKPWLAAESPQDARSALGAGDGGKDEAGAGAGAEEPQHCAFGDGPTRVGGQSERRPWQAEGERVGGGRPRKASREEADFRVPWSGESRGVALSHAKDPSPSPAPNRHRLFAITLRATPVIRPIMLPLLRALSSEDPLGGGQREEALPRPGKSQEMPSTPITTGMRGPPLKHVGHRGLEDRGGVASVSRMETMGTVSSPPLAGEGEGAEPPPDALWKASVSDSDPGKLEAPRCIPTIALPEGGSQDQPPPQQLGPSWEEQTQDCKSHFLCTPRAGPPGRWAAGELATSPHSSSLEGSSGHSPAASSVWDDTSQGPSELGLMPGEPRASTWANPSPARAARREDLTHAFVWEASSDPQLEPSAEHLRALSPGGSTLEVAASPAVFPERAEPSSHLERAAAKPPAVPPKTEKALRRAKKLASKRRKTDQAQEAPGKAQEQPPLEDAERGPLSPGERPLPRFPAVRALPPPVHRHSVSTFPEPLRRRPGRPQSLMPLLPYPATQKVLQDPQSGEYFVFDLPLQVKIKTFYDPETGKYVKVPIPSSEEGSPEARPLDMLAVPYVLYPGLRPLPAAVMPPRCSSQLSSPTFLRQGPGPQSAPHADPQPAPGPQGDPTQHAAGRGSRESPRIPGEGAVDTASLGIICTNDLEDFATEGIS